MNCRVLDCPIPVAGIIFDDLVPTPDTVRVELCESHLRAEMVRRVDDRRHFSFQPLAVLTSAARMNRKGSNAAAA